MASNQPSVLTHPLSLETRSSYLHQFSGHLCESHISRDGARNQPFFREDQNLCIDVCPRKNLKKEKKHDYRMTKKKKTHLLS